MGWRLLVVLMVGGMGWQMPGWAHGARIDYRSTPAIEIQAQYDSGEPMANAQVTIYTPTDPTSPWLTGMTTQAGRFWFEPEADQPGNWEVTVRQSGHGDIVVIPVEAPLTGSVDQEEESSGTLAPEVNGNSSSGAFTPLQKSLMVGSILWGCVGTALFFSRSRS